MKSQMCDILDSPPSMHNMQRAPYRVDRFQPRRMKYNLGYHKLIADLVYKSTRKVCII